MAWIETVDEQDAKGAVEDVYVNAKAASGMVSNIVKIASLNPPALQALMGMYGAVMFRRSPLSRAQREMVATVVSQINDCHY